MKKQVFLKNILFWLFSFVLVGCFAIIGLNLNNLIIAKATTGSCGDNHNFVENVCECGAKQVNVTGEFSGCIIESINGKPYVEGEKVIVLDGEGLEIVFKNVASDVETDVFVGNVKVDGEWLDFYVDETTDIYLNSKTVGFDVFIVAYAVFEIKIDLKGGSVTDSFIDVVIIENGIATVTEFNSYGCGIALLGDWFEYEGHTLVGATDGENEYKFLDVEKDYDLELVWECLAGSISFVEETAATCLKNGEIAHYKCVCGELFADALGEIKLSPEDIIVESQPDLHVFNNSLCECGAKQVNVTGEFSGCRIESINGKPYVEGEKIIVLDGEGLEIGFKNVASDVETDVFVGNVNVDGEELDFNEEENVIYLNPEKVGFDVFIIAEAVFEIKIDLKGGSVKDSFIDDVIIENGIATVTGFNVYGCSISLLNGWFEYEGHTLVCATDGENEYTTLSVKNDYYLELVWDCLDSSISFVQETIATCVKDGEIAHYKCVCGRLYVDALGETELSEEDLVVVDENAHVWDSGEITKNPTKREEGIKTYTCEHNNEHTKTEKLPKLEKSGVGGIISLSIAGVIALAGVVFIFIKKKLI